MPKFVRLIYFVHSGVPKCARLIDFVHFCVPKCARMKDFADLGVLAKMFCPDKRFGQDDFPEKRFSQDVFSSGETF